MHSNELKDFAAASAATHSYTNQQIVNYFMRLVRIVSADGVRSMIGIVRAHRPAVMLALIKAGVVRTTSDADDQGNDGDDESG